MGGCQTNIPCTHEIKSRKDSQTLINDINSKDIIIKDKKSSYIEEPGISN